jgi:hypothetical protein
VLGVSPDYGTTQHTHAQKEAKSSGRPSAAERGCSGVSPDFENPTRTHAEKGLAERKGRAERSEEGELGGFPRLRYNTAHPRAEESQAQRPGRAQRQRRGSEVPPDYGNPTRAHAEGG